jgi:hypothetical protein
VIELLRALGVPCVWEDETDPLMAFLSARGLVRSIFRSNPVLMSEG